MTQTSANDDALQTLKSLLLGEEQQQIEEITERIEDPELRSGDLAEVLPEAIRLSSAKGDDLTDALEPPVTECIQRSIQRDPENLANALYPVMGPAIRQSISSALKGMIENLNRTMEQSFSLQGLQWRLEAKRSGVPFPEVVMRHTLAFRVEQVFLIQPGSGLLMQHVQDEQTAASDTDAISGMLTAITQFVRDAFQAGDNEGLETVEIGDHTVLLAHGPKAYLAAVVRGVIPIDLRSQCQEALETIHARFRSPLTDYAGDPETLSETAPLLQRCLQSRAKPKTERRGPSPAVLVLLLLLLLLLGWLGYEGWRQHQAEQAWQAQQRSLVTLLDRQPGITVTDVVFGDDRLGIRGLRDPLAAPLDPLLEQAGITPEQVQMQWHPYQDLDPTIVLQRARQKLAPPKTVELELQGDRLRASGYADAAWLQRAHLIAVALPGISTFDDSGLDSVDTYLLREAGKRLQPPPGVELRVQQRVLQLAGTAPLDWIESIDTKLETLQELQAIERHALASTEAAQFDRLRSRIENTFIHFAEEDQLIPGERERLDSLAQDLQQLQRLGGLTGRAFQVLVIGSADGIGPPDLNERIALTRAVGVRDHLADRQLPVELFRIQTRVAPLPVLDPALRRAEFRILPQETK